MLPPVALNPKRKFNSVVFFGFIDCDLHIGSNPLQPASYLHVLAASQRAEGEGDPELGR